MRLSTSNHRRAATVVAITVMAVAAALMGFGVDNPNDHSIFRLGLCLSFPACVALVLVRSSIAEHFIEQTRQHAYDEGYADGCEVARRRMRSIDSAGRRFAHGSTPQQFSQERDVASGADRVG